MGPDDREEGRREDEDLFEDLDQFFAPIEDADWPDPEAADAEPAPGAQPEAEGGLEDWGLEIDIPDEDELVAGADAASTAADQRGQEPAPQEPPPPERPPAPEPPAPPEERPAPERPAPPEQPAPAAEGFPAPASDDDWIEQATAEMGGEEWDRLRGELAEEPEEGPAAEEPGPTTPPEPSEAPSEPPVSVDDLRSAPREYADLPGGDEAPEVTSASDLFEERVEPAAPAEPTAAAPRDDRAAVDEEPEPAAIEAAAEHFASGMRESPEDVERELLSDLEEPSGVRAVRIEPGAAAEAPTWQEGAEVIPEEERGPPPGGRNLPAAFASGALLAVAVVALLAVGKGAFTVLAAAAVLLGQGEFYAVMQSRGRQPATLLGLVSGALIIAGAYFRGDGGMLLGLFLAMALTVLWYMAASPKSRHDTTGNAATTILGVVYVPFLASFAILLLVLPGPIGRNLFLTVVALTVLYDVVAYAVGSIWGSRPLAPTISPQKSWEGVLGATFVLLLVSLAIVPSIDPFNASRALGLALVISVAAPLGDLVESALKRDLRVKDMGTLLPGHGGMLDRIDAILFTAPAAYYFLQISF